MDRPPAHRYNPSIDVGRVVCFCAVVALHVAWSPTAERWSLRVAIDGLARFAVPVFFMLAGYFASRRAGGEAGLVRRYVVRLAPPFVVWEAVYYGVFFLLLPRVTEHYAFNGVGAEAVEILTSGGLAFHLWFLIWLPVHVGAFVVLSRWFGRRGAYAAAAALFVAALALGPYNVAVGLDGVVGRFMAAPERFTARPLFGLAFVALGFAVGAGTIRAPRRAAPLVALFLLGYALQTAEWLAIAADARAAGLVKPLGFDVTLGTVAMALGVFLLMTGDHPTGAVARRVAPLGRHVFGAYCLHLLLWLSLQHFVLFSLALDPVVEAAVRGVGAVAIVVASLTAAAAMAEVRFLRPLVT
jgi:surface polysaccharide O-acyltransferase-like enzyme